MSPSYPPQISRNYAGQQSQTDLELTNRGGGGRTPSPTPSEADALSHAGAFDWKRLGNWRFWIRKEWTWYYLIGIIIVTAVALVSFFHNQLVDFLKPAATWMHDLKFGWLIPIGILFVISFPPLFGHEIVGILCGLVWGLWVGFGIVAAGTFLGEVGNFYAFMWCCRARGEKLERTSIFYACLAQVVRDGGFKVALIARLSAIPGHFTTAVFATCGMGIIVFSIAAILSLPKQFLTVYLGVILEQSADGTQVSKKDNIIKYTVLAVTTLITLWAVWYIYAKMGQVKVQVIHARRKARQVKMNAAKSPYGTNLEDMSSTSALNPAHSSQFDLAANRTHFNPHANFNPDSSSEPYQRWDDNGRAVGYAGDPNLMFAPTPTRAAGYTPSSRRSEEDVGYQYPMGEVGSPDGRTVVRQRSDDSESGGQQQQHVAAGYGAPRVSGSPSPTDNYPNPFNTRQPTLPSMSSNPNAGPAQGRVYSPPPPSYRTNLH